MKAPSESQQAELVTHLALYKVILKERCKPSPSTILGLERCAENIFILALGSTISSASSLYCRVG